MKGYDEPEILRSQLSQFGPISADAGQSAAKDFRALLRKSQSDDAGAALAHAAKLPHVAFPVQLLSRSSIVVSLTGKGYRTVDSSNAAPTRRYHEDIETNEEFNPRFVSAFPKGNQMAESGPTFSPITDVQATRRLAEWPLSWLSKLLPLRDPHEPHPNDCLRRVGDFSERHVEYLN